MSKYPNCEKLEAVSEKSQEIGEFLEWLSENCYYIAEYHTTECTEDTGVKCDRLLEVTHNKEALLAKFFGIDMNKVEKERLDMLEEIRKKNKEVKR